ncbi:MAG: EMC3/TMCO1 family protein [Candidatus Pacearchaeota archaeon]|jgi:uncharacterized membrane protein (DUF106 family)
MENKSGRKSMTIIIIVMFASLIIASLWDKWAWIKNSIHTVLDPTAGFLLDWNMTIGMLIIVLILNVLITLVQKYTTDQKELKRIKAEQKDLQKQIKEARLKGDTAKMSELTKKNMSYMPQQFKLSMGSIAYTAVPLILFYRWFDDYFKIIVTNTGEPVRFFGFMGWFIFYLVFSIIFSSIFKKVMDVA